MKSAYFLYYGQFVIYAQWLGADMWMFQSGTIVEASISAVVARLDRISHGYGGENFW